MWRKSTRTLRNSAFALIGGFLSLIIAAGCSEERKIDVAAQINPKKMATMTTKNIATFISDSGVVQYKIVSPLWQVFEEKDTPFWSFPKGLYLQKYDPYFHVVATVAADSAKFFKNEKLWRLDGRVELTQEPKGLFQTQQLFWDQRRGILYSDSFIHIETETHVLEGMGFESDENLRSYRIVKPQGIFPINGGAMMQPGAEPASPGAAQPLVPATGPQPQPRQEAGALKETD